MNTIPSITLRTVERDLTLTAQHYDSGNHAAALAHARELLSHAEGLVLFLEQLAQPGTDLNNKESV